MSALHCVITLAALFVWVGGFTFVLVKVADAKIAATNSKKGNR